MCSPECSFLNLFRFWRIFWVDASTAETIDISLQDIATDPDARASGVEHSSKSILQWLSRVEHDWLIVFDNASYDHDAMAKYLPPGNQGNILITSRNVGLTRYVSRDACIELDNMEEEDAVSLLLKSSLLNEYSVPMRQAARSIVQELCCLPLAIDQAGAAIASGLCDINDYLARYSQHRQALLGDLTFKGASHYGQAVYGTWDVSFTAIKAMDTAATESAIFILETFAFLHHDNISEAIIKRAAEALEEATLDGSSNACLPHPLVQLDQEGKWDPFYFREGIRNLLSFSLIKKAAVSGVYSLHPLVHAWSCDRMSHQQQLTSCSCAMDLLSNSITFNFGSEDYAFRQTLIPHIKATEKCTTAMGVALCYDDKQCINFGLVFHEAGNWKEAERLWVEVQQRRKRVLGEEHPSTLAIMSNLASTYWNQGRWKEAEGLQVQVLQTRKRVLGEEHPDTLTIMSNLASTYWKQGQWKEAEELDVQVLQTSKRVLGEEHPDTLTSMSNLASTYQYQGQWKEAAELKVQVLQASKRVLGEEHPDTLTSMSNLAVTYWNQGWWKEAEELEVQVLETSKRVLGEEHFDTLASMSNLASTYQHQGQWKEAEELEVQVLHISKRVLGEEHPVTLASMSNLAVTHWNQGRWKEAEELLVQALHTRKRVLGEEHPDTLTIMSNLASTYQNQGWWKEAEELQVQVLETSKRVLGEDHSDTLQRMSNLALTRKSQGKGS
jgi:tetratricopeptide (TPR) repeat protein